MRDVWSIDVCAWVTVCSCGGLRYGRVLCDSSKVSLKVRLKVPPFSPVRDRVLWNLVAACTTNRLADLDRSVHEAKSLVTNLEEVFPEDG